MEHYVCSGTCGAVSSEPGVCTTDGCTKQDEALAYCNCEDGSHSEIAGK
ncbi:MAG TPA: hypothetical protein VHF05_03215 [Candidatus Paceibacterota bacterium]|nr:hypothetical protein [Candidatus Paceibacterota bacterium]